MTLRRTLEVTQADEPIALRLLSALVLEWDLLPYETQDRLLLSAALMRSGFPNATVLPATMMAFVDQHKEPSCVGQTMASPTAKSATMKRLWATR